MTSPGAASGWARAIAITVALAFIALLFHLGAGWEIDRLSLFVWVWVTAQGLNVSLSSVRSDSRAAEVGRGVFVSGLLAITVWSVDRLQRDFEQEQTARQQAFEQRQSLQLTIGLRHDLSGIDLRDKDLSDFQLAGKDLSDSNLSGALLTGANLAGAQMTGTALVGADLGAADLTGADLTEADLSGADLSGAKLESTVLTDANLSEADLAGANLEGADLPGACLAGADLSDATLPGTDLTSAVLTGAKLEGAVLETDLRPAVYPGAGFAGATMSAETEWPNDTAPTGRINPESRSFNVPELASPATAHADTVVAVEDGDTVELENGGAARLIGVDSPDLGSPRGEEARAYAEKLLEGTEVAVLSGTDGHDIFGRKLVYLWLPDGSSFNQGLLETGNATLLLADPFAEQALRAAEQRAKQLGLGYWQECPTGD